MRVLNHDWIWLKVHQRLRTKRQLYQGAKRERPAYGLAATGNEWHQTDAKAP